MNKQSKTGIEWTWVYGRQGYTWNPIGGCKHGCEWVMPDGATAQCYAKTIAERFTAAYPQGFAHHYWRPHKLDEPLKVKEPGGVFVDSMSDLFGHWVSDEQIRAVLDICRQADWHIFFVLTKNPRRLLNFEFPDNVWVGASSAPDVYMGKTWDERRKQVYMDKTLWSLSQVNAQVTWMSFEPLSNDYSYVMAQYSNAIDWAVIGAASNGTKEYPPDVNHFQNMLEVLDKAYIPVFFKGNLQSLPEAKADWREMFPGRTDTAIKQLGLF